MNIQELTVSDLKDYLELAIKEQEFLIREMRINGTLDDKNLPPLYKNINNVIMALRKEGQKRLTNLIN